MYRDTVRSDVMQSTYAWNKPRKSNGELCNYAKIFVLVNKEPGLTKREIFLKLGWGTNINQRSTVFADATRAGFFKYGRNWGIYPTAKLTLWVAEKIGE